MTSYEKLSTKILFRSKCQYDYEHVSFNQCTWYAFAILGSLKKRNWAVPEENLETFKKMNEDALIVGSELRKKHGVASWGESIFSKAINRIYKMNVQLPRISLINPDKQNIFSSDVVAAIPQMKGYFKFKESLPKVDYPEFLKILRSLHEEKSYLLINRFGETFLIYPKYSSSGERDQLAFFIFDSHIRDFGVFSYESVLEYINGPMKGSFVDVAWMRGYMDDRESLSEEDLEKYFL